jgi:hypothetical protein
VRLPDIYTLKLPGTPPSFNAVGHSGNRWTWTKAKKDWDGYCMFALLESKVPKKLAKVDATATLFFRDKRKRDAVNYRTLLEKSLGDALQLGWLDDDDPEHFSFGAVRFEKVEKGLPPKTLVRLEVVPK